MDESRLRVYLYCYSNQDVDDLISYWSSICDIPKSQFTKPYVRKDFNPNQVRKMEHGLIHIRYSDKVILSGIKEMIDFYSSSLSIRVGGGVVNRT